MTIKVFTTLLEDGHSTGFLFVNQNQFGKDSILFHLHGCVNTLHIYLLKRLNKRIGKVSERK